jgi:hypothetical protein
MHLLLFSLWRRYSKVTSKLLTKPSIKPKSANRSIQFSCYESTLPERIEREMKLAGYTSRPKYLNALLEKVFSLVPTSANGSCLDALSNLMQLFESLPTESVRELAPTQNRNFDQMFKHLLEMALDHYAENLLQASTASEVWLNRNLINSPKTGHYKDKIEAVNHESVHKRALRN